MSQDKITELEKQLFALTAELQALRRDHRGDVISNYTFKTLEGEVSLRELFGDNDKLLLIHNMGKGCVYCTTWADGLSGFVPHLESVMSVALVSKDAPDVQHAFASGRGWGFRLASHGGGAYLTEQGVKGGTDNYPGCVVYEREGDTIYRKNEATFGPGDQFCSLFDLLGLAGVASEDFSPKFAYGDPAT